MPNQPSLENLKLHLKTLREEAKYLSFQIVQNLSTHPDLRHLPEDFNEAIIKTSQPLIQKALVNALAANAGITETRQQVETSVSHLYPGFRIIINQLSQTQRELVFSQTKPKNKTDLEIAQKAFQTDTTQPYQPHDPSLKDPSPDTYRDELTTRLKELHQFNPSQIKDALAITDTAIANNIAASKEVEKLLPKTETYHSAKDDLAAYVLKMETLIHQYRETHNIDTSQYPTTVNINQAEFEQSTHQLAIEYHSGNHDYKTGPFLNFTPESDKTKTQLNQEFHSPPTSSPEPLRLAGKTFSYGLRRAKEKGTKKILTKVVVWGAKALGYTVTGGAIAIGTGGAAIPVELIVAAVLIAKDLVKKSIEKKKRQVKTAIKVGAFSMAALGILGHAIISGLKTFISNILLTVTGTGLGVFAGFVVAPFLGPFGFLAPIIGGIGGFIFGPDAIKSLWSSLTTASTAAGGTATTMATTVLSGLSMVSFAAMGIFAPALALVAVVIAGILTFPAIIASLTSTLQPSTQSETGNGQITRSCADTTGAFIWQNNPSWGSTVCNQSLPACTPPTGCTIGASGCGSTSTTMILNSFGTGFNVTSTWNRQHDIDGYVYGATDDGLGVCFTAHSSGPLTIFQENGLSYSYLGTNWDQAETFLEDCALIYTSGTAYWSTGSGGHILVITGIQKSSAGEVTAITTLDPAKSNGNNFTHQITGPDKTYNVIHMWAVVP